MSTTHSVQTFFEIIMIMGVIIGLIYEPSIVEWEQKQLKKLKRKKVNK